MPDPAHAAARLLISARHARHPLERLPETCAPRDLAEAYAIQDRLAELLLIDAGGGTVVGWKAACTNKTAQDQLGVTEPFRGTLLSPAVSHASPATLPAERFFMRTMEPEIAFRLGRDLPPSPTPYRMEHVYRAIDAAMPALEIVDSRYVDWTTIGALHLVADNACAGHWVHGPLVTDWHRFDFTDFPVSISVDGEIRQRGNSANVLGNPLNVVVWLANQMSARGRTLRAGQMVTTGTCTVVVPVERGQKVRGEFGPLGHVEVTFT